MLEISNAKQRRTLERIFKQPTPNDILWSNIESLLKLEYREGSRVKITKGNITHRCHRPHPSNQTKPHTVEGIRNFLDEIGVKP